MADFETYINDLQDTDLRDFEAFRQQLVRGMSLMLLDDMACAELFDVSRTTVVRWRNGTAKPHLVVRKLVWKELEERARRCERLEKRSVTYGGPAASPAPMAMVAKSS